MNMKHESKRKVEEITVCGACRQHTHREPDKWGDYSEKYCTECWGIGNPFRYSMEEVENRLNNEIDNIDKEWKNIAIDNRKKKLGIKTPI